MAGPPANRVRQSYGSAPATPRERVYVSRAADDPPESAPPAGCTRKSRPDPGIDRASSPSRRITAGKVNHRPFALASFFSKLLGHLQQAFLLGDRKHLRGFQTGRRHRSPFVIDALLVGTLAGHLTS